jgi:hypothetical protein
LSSPRRCWRPLWIPVVAKEAPPPLYASTIAKYPAPALLSDVDGREYKILFDPAKTSPDMATAFKDLWDKIKAAAAKQGMQVTEKDKNPLAIEFSTKEYFDTPDQALWSKGYLIRITTRYKDGKPNDPVAVTVKAVFEDAGKTTGGSADRGGRSTRSRPRLKRTSASVRTAACAGTSRRAHPSVCRWHRWASSPWATSASTCLSCSSSACPPTRR